MNKATPIGWTNAIRVYWAQWREYFSPTSAGYRGVSGYVALVTCDDKADPLGYSEGVGYSDSPHWVLSTGYDRRRENRDHKRFAFGVPKVSPIQLDTGNAAG